MTLSFGANFMKLPAFFTEELFSVSNKQISLLTISIFATVIITALILSFIMQKGLKKGLSERFHKREGTLAAFLRLLHYIILLIGFIIALKIVGIDLSALFAAGAIFALAIGFAMQHIIQNFVSGLILLLERSIKPGDILEVEGVLVKVIAMGIRTTVVRTRFEEDLIMPNSIISQSTVKNYTLRDNKFRLEVLVGVSYDSDMEQVLKVLRSVVLATKWKVDDNIRVLMKDFGASSVDFGIYLNTDDPWNKSILKSDLRQDIWFAFKKEGIVIAYPQLDIHFDKPVNEALDKLSN